MKDAGAQVCDVEEGEEAGEAPVRASGPTSDNAAAIIQSSRLTEFFSEPQRHSDSMYVPTKERCTCVEEKEMLLFFKHRAINVSTFLHMRNKKNESQQ